MLTNMSAEPKFIDHPNVASNKDAYIDGVLDIAKALPSWQQSLLAYKWLTSEGHAKPLDTLGGEQRTRYDEALALLSSGKPLQKPIIGIGMVDNIEVGSGAAIVVLMAHKGITQIPVHIRAGMAKKLMKFMV